MSSPDSNAKPAFTGRQASHDPALQTVAAKTGAKCGRQQRSGFARRVINLCPYTHLGRAIRQMIAQRQLPDTARPGAFIALLGLFCPIFWIAFFTGAPRSELIFHAVHSGIVFGAGVLLFVGGLTKSIRRDDPDER